MIEILIKIPEGLKDVFENRNVTALDVEEMRMAIKNGTPLTEWLNSFDTNSATKCFEAVNILKQRLEGEE